ncbi:uncharacterized protein LOC113464749 [Ceratina calcarata]|uniref:Uncharacterized protein LOC113464749 n=1 Tax=Ceratina calcarata TaxID=156304 RepID=A0AAJ7WDE4_9HYME|nr:uncharacterized protein LOC113464749 [Ceratina calcarata]
MLNRVYGFQNNQKTILIQRFHEVDKKYDILKLNYYKLVQDASKLKQKYINLQMEVVELKKKLLSHDVQNRTMHSNDTVTPVNGIRNGCNQMRYKRVSYKYKSMKHSMIRFAAILNIFVEVQQARISLAERMERMSYYTIQQEARKAGSQEVSITFVFLIILIPDHPVRAEWAECHQIDQTGRRS